MQQFEVKSPDGRAIVHDAESLEDLQAALAPGYEVSARVVGGLRTPLNGPSLMQQLLDAHGDELLAWLKANNISPNA